MCRTVIHLLLCDLFRELVAVRDTKIIPGVKNEPGIVRCDVRDAAFLNVNVSFLLNTGRTCEHLGCDFSLYAFHALW